MTEVHIADVLAGVRPQDVAEFWAASHATPARCLSLGVHYGQESWTGLVDGRVVCIFGVAGYSLLGQSGTVWMLGHRRLDRHARGFLRACRPQIETLLGRYRHLSNWVDARNARAIRWLGWLGFQVHPAVPHGVEGLPFHYFEMHTNV